jgi:hypothetical protein
MSFLRAARAALAGLNCLPRIPVALVVVAVFVLAGLSLSCGSSSHGTSGHNHNAYVTLPARGSVLLLHINGATGAITLGAETPQVQNTSPTGIPSPTRSRFSMSPATGLWRSVALRVRRVTVRMMPSSTLQASICW